MTRRELLGALFMGAVSLSVLGIDVEEIEAGLNRKPPGAPTREPWAALFDHSVYVNKRAKELYTGEISLVSAHRREAVRVRYLDKQGRFDRNSCRLLSSFFRCHYSGRSVPIAPTLFLVLDGMRNVMNLRQRSYTLYSGYRCPAYNKKLVRRDSGVARNSFHIKGMAADIAMPGARLSDLEKAARHLCMGGVGGYDDFVHVDVGPIRTW